MSRCGFTEVVMVTAHTHKMIAFLCDLGWTAERYDMSPESIDFWDLAQPQRDSHLLHAPSGECSVRLLSVSEQVPVARPLDTELIVPCGIFDINMRTNNSEFAFDFIQRHGWRPITDPIPWNFGDVSVKEFLSIQDDGIVLAVMERVSPPLPGKPFDRMSDIFNSTQVVQHIDDAIDFLEVLGFSLFIDFAGPMPGEGPRVLGLEQYPQELGDIRLTVSHPDGVMEGSIELIATPKLPRESIARAAQAARGLHALRIPCVDIQARYQDIADSRWSANIHKPLAERDFGQGSQLCAAFLTPEGARLELFEAPK